MYGLWASPSSRFKMRFLYTDYLDYLEQLRAAGYVLSTFEGNSTPAPSALIRHDIDVSPVKALEMAQMESTHQVQATYFVLLTSRFYNLLERENEQAIRAICKLGHEVGVHFDFSKYGASLSHSELQDAVFYETGILSRILEGRPIHSISWHIPMKAYLGKDVPLFSDSGELKNAYSSEYFYGYKYISDSMMRWREVPEQMVSPSKYPKLQILTHPIWYSKEGEHSDLTILTELRQCRRQEMDSYLETLRPGFCEQISSMGRGGTEHGTDL